MIISHLYKFIFLKTNKTAGISIEIALSKFCGPKDVITAITAEDEKIRNELGCWGPQNHLSAPWDYNVADAVRFLTKGERKHKFEKHISVSKVRANVGCHIFDSYFKFSVERNPWDRVVSLYYWRNQSEPRPTFSEFVAANTLLALKRRGFELYTIDRNIVVDKICRFESLSEDLEIVRKQLGIPEGLTLPRAKSRFRKGKSYRDYFGEKEKAKVAELFSDEIRLFGYKF